MKLSEIIGGLQILAPYYKDGDGYHCGAEHDEFYAYKTDRPLSPEDVQKMIDLNWHQEYYARDYSKDFCVDDYRQNECWVAYV